MGVRSVVGAEEQTTRVASDDGGAERCYAEFTLQTGGGGVVG